MPTLAHPGTAPASSLDTLDRLTIIYLVLPLPIFLIGWLVPWLAAVLVAGVAYTLFPLFDWTVGGDAARRKAPQFAVAAVVGIGWTVLGGTGHFVFANPDWHIRDAVLHDLVASPWPVGYGLLDGRESILRTSVAYYLPAALVGKWAGLHAAHLAMAAWTALGTTLFLSQVLTIVPARKSAYAISMLVIVFFSGFDIVGSLLNDGPHFRMYWTIANHLEWWAGLYQYSSMSTQLFWVPNHALGGWLTIGLLARPGQNGAVDRMLPMIVVALALWSPLAAIGTLPFVLWKMIGAAVRGRLLNFLHPQVWAPALLVGAVVAAYLGLDAISIPHGRPASRDDLVMDLLQQAQFVLLEAWLIGIAVLAIYRSSQLILALVILALLPLVSFGPANDFVMRASIPSLAVLALAACIALTREESGPRDRLKRFALAGMLLIGAVTAVQEIARAVLLPAWPINLEATLVGAACGAYPPHYVAHLDQEFVVPLLRSPHRIELGPMGSQSCFNPALRLMWFAGLLQE